MRRTWAIAAAVVVAATASTGLAGAQTATGGRLPSQSSVGTESHSAPAYGSRRVTRRVETDQHIIALTLDDGYHPDPRVLDLIQTWGLRGTAFVVGQVARDNPQLVRRLAALGWEVCSHTWNHRNLTGLSDYEIYREMSRAKQEIDQLSGQHCPYFRPPYGAVDSRVILTANKLGLKIINWDSSLSDSTTPGTDPKIQINLAFQYLRPGSILLGHFGAVNSYEVLKEVLTGTLAAGYRVGTVTELLQAAGESVPPAATTQQAPQPTPATAPAVAKPVAVKPVAVQAADAAPILDDTKKVSNTTGFVRLAVAVAALFLVLIGFRARGGRRRLQAHAHKQLARQRHHAHSHHR